MMDIKYNFENLKNFIKNGDRISCGNLNNYVYHDSLLVKFDDELLKTFKRNPNVDEDDIRRIFYDNKKGLIKSAVDFNKLDYFKRVSKDIKLSSLPEGVMYLEDIPIGTIEPYFKNYRWLHFMEDVSHKEMYYLLRNILLSLYELEQNGIYRLNLDRNNIMYNGKKPELVDLMNKDVIVGKNDKLQQEVYSNYLDLLYSIIYRQSFDAMLYKEFQDVLRISDCTYDECESVLKRLKKKI